MSTLKDIEGRQQRLLQLFDQLQREEDMTRYLQIVQQMELEANELQGVVLAFDAKMQGQMRSPKGSIEVVLTPEQRSRINRETGISMTTVLISDPGGQVNEGMPATRPDVVEKEAMRQAKERQAFVKARDEAMRQVEEQLREIEQQNELSADAVAKLRADPKFKSLMTFGDK